MPYDIDIISEEAIVCRIKLDRLLLWMSKVFNEIMGKIGGKEY